MTALKTNVVMTTIHDPSLAVRSLAAIEEISLTVVGDRKTPKGWFTPHATFLSTGAQLELGYGICDLLPYDHYCRKNIGYVHAIRNGADIIIDTDDDNTPKHSWGFPPFAGSYACTASQLGFVNVYKHFTEQHIWPRGFPLRLVRSVLDAPMPISDSESVTVGVWQGLADGDPDVDAIYRLLFDQPCTFNEEDPLVLSAGTICPFNSQNTAFRKELFPLLYLPAFVSFRYTDILRGLVAQPIMWQSGFLLGFTKATVTQQRNPHDYMKDFRDEIPCYLHADEVVECVSSAITPRSSIADNLYLAYDALRGKGIVDGREMKLLSLWLKDIL